MKPNGCVEYIRATVSINFQADHICCDLCPLMETYSRKQCRRTGNYIVDSRTIDPDCPLKFEVNDEQ